MPSSILSSSSESVDVGGELTPLLPAEVAALDTRRVVVLDTSVLMADPQAYLAYPGARIVIPMTVIDELDNNKTRRDEAGRNARTVLRSIEALRLQAGGRITTPVDLPDDATLVIALNGLDLQTLIDAHLPVDVADHRIIGAALGSQGDSPVPVLMVSNDAALRIKASVVGLEAAEHTPGSVGRLGAADTGMHPIDVSHETIDRAATRAAFSFDDIPAEDAEALDVLCDNEFALLNGTAFLLRRRGDLLMPAARNHKAWGATAKNKEQAAALDLLLDDDVAMVALRGHAGTGKSLLAIAAGLQKVVEDRTYKQLMILRPMISVGGEDLGFLPGDVADKVAPWFRAVVDSVLALADDPKVTFEQAEQQVAELLAQGRLAFEPITFLRGRSLQGVYLIADECQNLEPSTMKTIISRLGKGSKLVMTGDSGQIDNGYLSEVTCGLNVVVDAFSGVDLFGHVHFSKGERSRLADLAAQLL